MTLSLAAAAVRQGAELLTGFDVSAIETDGDRVRSRRRRELRPSAPGGVNCAGLGAGRVARLAGDDTFEVYPRKGEFLVFDPPGDRLARILLPVPTKRTKGVLVFPTLDGKVVAGPTAIDQSDPGDWSVRKEAAGEIIPKARAMYPPLADAEPVFAYAGLRPAGRGSNYLISPSTAEPAPGQRRRDPLDRADRLARDRRARRGTSSARPGSSWPEADLLLGEPPEPDGPWWRRTARYRAAEEDEG